MISIFSDCATIEHALAFETALARAQAAEGVIDREAAEAIAAVCATIEFDLGDLAEEATLAGAFAIPLVGRLRAKLSGSAASAVHKGATSQDVADTVLMIQVCAAAKALASDARRICDSLRAHALKYAATPALGRTLLQDAAPIGFGLRLAQSAAGIEDAAARLAAEVAANTRVQFGGAAGTRSGLNDKGGAIARSIADHLGLKAGPPWHARRVGVAAIAAAVGILIGAMGKLARDISLLAQNAIGEAREPSIPGRGGSSSMRHKRNLTGCQVALSAAVRAPGLVAGILSGMPQEEERGLGGWQAEGPTIADLFLLASGSASAMAVVVEGLAIDLKAVARNLGASGLGADIGESERVVLELFANPGRG